MTFYVSKSQILHGLDPYSLPAVLPSLLAFLVSHRAGRSYSRSSGWATSLHVAWHLLRRQIKIRKQKYLERPSTDLLTPELLSMCCGSGDREGEGITYTSTPNSQSK